MSRAKAAAAASAALAVGVDPETAEGGSGGASVIHSREKVSLCYEIILDHFGSITARVAAILLQRGRLTMPEICRFLANPALHAPTGYIPDADEDNKESNMDAADDYLGTAPGAGSSLASASSSANGPLKSKRRIRQALLTMIQHNMCWHARTTANGMLVQATDEGYDVGSVEGVEQYQMNVDAVLPRLRFGAYLTIAEKHYYEIGREVVEVILQNGKLRAKDVVMRLMADAGGTAKEKLKYEREILECLTIMLQQGYLQPYIPLLNASPRDRRIHKEALYITQTKKLVGEAERKNMAQNARREVAVEDVGVWGSASSTRGCIDGLKARKVRKFGVNGQMSTDQANTDEASTRIPTKRGRPSKKMKQERDEPAGMINGNDWGPITTSDEEDDAFRKGEIPPVIDPECVLRAYFPRFDTHVRDDIIADAVAARFNSAVALVMRSMLEQASDVFYRDDRSGGYSRDQIQVAPPSVHETLSTPLRTSRVRVTHKDGNMQDAFDRTTIKRSLGGDVTQKAVVNEVLNVLMGVEDMSGSAHAKRFLAPTVDSSTEGSSRPLPANSSNSVQIQYRNIARALRAQILQNVVRAQFDTTGVRIMSLLRDTGKLDEKTISKLGLLPIGETRDVCSRLFAAGLLSLQEVPKSSDRAPGRTFFLWFVDVRKCNAWLANRLYKTLSRLAQRRRQEYAREAQLMGKSLHRANASSAASQESMMRDIERLRLERVRETIRMLTLAETRTWRDLFVVTTLPE